MKEFGIFSTEWKSKEDGSIVTIISKSYSSSESTITIIGGDGIKNTISLNSFYKNYERVEIDFMSYKDQIVEQCYLNSEFAKLGNVVLRKLDPDYYKPGKLVYFCDQGIFFKHERREYEHQPEIPYVIVNIKADKIDSGVLNINIRNAMRKSDEIDFSLPIHITRLEIGDAYWYLKRYDKPY